MTALLLLALLACTGSDAPTDPAEADGSRSSGALPPVEGPDADGDGLSDADEARVGSDPDNPDTDGDGKSDGYEVHVHGTDPTNKDTDGDGVADGAEISTHGTDPLVPDHDGPPPDPDARPRAAGDPGPPPDGAPRNEPTRIPGWDGDQPPDELRCGAGGGYHCFTEIPAGTFTMGAQATDPGAPHHDPAALPDESPPHEVAVASFWIMKAEVPAYLYRRCVMSGWCSEDEVETRDGFSNYARLAESPRLGDPLNSITWEGARQICTWMGGRLPTEAEWEYAARGTDGRRFPWGDDPGCGVSVVSDATSTGRAIDLKTMKRESCVLPGPPSPAVLVGESPFGLLGMGGSVWEWVADPYSPTAYTDGVPTEGDERVQRGGGWTSDDPIDFRAAARMSMAPDAKVVDVGVRCAWPGER